MYQAPSQESGTLRGSRAPSRASTTDSQALPPHDRENRTLRLSRESLSAPDSGRPKPPSARASGVAHRGKPRVRPRTRATPPPPREVEPSRGFRREWMRLHPSRARPPPPPQGGLVSRHPRPAGLPQRLGRVPAGRSPGHRRRAGCLPRNSRRTPARPSGPRAAHPTNLRRQRPAGSGHASPRGTGRSHGQAPGARREETPAGEGCRVRGLGGGRGSRFNRGA